MKDFKIDMNGNAPHSTFAKAWAFPPFYVLRIPERCPHCRKAQYVYTLGCSAFREGDWDEEVEDFFFLRRIVSLPAAVLKLLKKKCPDYVLDREDGARTPYLMNHCQCGAALDDDFLHGDVGAAFWPDTPDGYKDFNLFLMPIDEAIPVDSSYMLGGGEYLDFDHVEPWTEL